MIVGEHLGHRQIGLPDRIRACLFDLDVVLIQSAAIHAAAWKSILDRFLEEHARDHGIPFVPFDVVEEYPKYVEGVTRDRGLRQFLAARGITLPDDTRDEQRSGHTVARLARDKTELALTLLREHEVAPYSGSLQYINALRAAGIRSAVVSASEHARVALDMARITHLFDERLDGGDADRMDLDGQPVPDMLLALARALWLFADEVAVFEVAPAGVTAARHGAFGYVVGVDRRGRPELLHEHGADVVVSDLSDLLRAG